MLQAVKSANPGSGDEPWVGRSIERVEDAALLTGRGRFIDDLGVSPARCTPPILRSPHAHAIFSRSMRSRASVCRASRAVLTGSDVKAVTTSRRRRREGADGVVADRDGPRALCRRAGRCGGGDDRARRRGCARADRGRIRPRAGGRRSARDARAGRAVLARGFRGNLASDRHFRYGDPESAFADGAASLSRSTSAIRAIPARRSRPMGVVASHDAGEDAYDVLANFQGPFSIHTVIARALKVPGNRLRLRTPPDSGGSFGVKQGVFPYIVLIAAAARVTGRPGQVDRGPARASYRVGVGDQPRDDAVGGGCSRRKDPRAGLGPGRGLRRAICARPSLPRSIACTAI